MNLKSTIVAVVSICLIGIFAWWLIPKDSAELDYSKKIPLSKGNELQEVMIPDAGPYIVSEQGPKKGVTPQRFRFQAEAGKSIVVSGKIQCVNSFAGMEQMWLNVTGAGKEYFEEELSSPAVRVTYQAGEDDFFDGKYTREVTLPKNPGRYRLHLIQFRRRTPLTDKTLMVFAVGEFTLTK